MNTNVNFPAAVGVPGLLGACLVLATEGGVGMPLDTPLRPGESYTTELVFDLPEGARDPVLFVKESSPETRFIIGHENSPLHGKTEFGL
ncbi:MAG: hypothetical protein ACJ74T_15275 [Pyrinomonadaceae bacterium]